MNSNFKKDATGKSPAFFAKSLPARVTSKMISELEEESRKNGGSNARICLHADSAANFHSMIVLERPALKSTLGGRFMRPHKHLDKGESFHLIKGRLLVCTFDDQGAVTDFSVLTANETPIYRVPINKFHGVFALTDPVIYHESKPGPFLGEGDSIFAPFAPSDPVQGLQWQTDLLKNLGCHFGGGTLRNFVTPLHTKSKRDYVARVVEHDKATCAETAKKFEREYWDGDRKFGYGGYHYDGRWKPVAENLIRTYGLSKDSSVLDVGCGKAHLLYELKNLLPGIRVKGLDVSMHAIATSPEGMKDHLTSGHAESLPFDDREFDLVISINTLHNLPLSKLERAISEVIRVSGKDAYICVESFRNEREKANLLYWQLTCESFYSNTEWQMLYERLGYGGDYEFIYFE